MIDRTDEQDCNKRGYSDDEGKVCQAVIGWCVLLFAALVIFTKAPLWVTTIVSALPPILVFGHGQILKRDRNRRFKDPTWVMLMSEFERLRVRELLQKGWSQADQLQKDTRDLENRRCQIVETKKHVDRLRTLELPPALIAEMDAEIERKQFVIDDFAKNLDTSGGGAQQALRDIQEMLDSRLLSPHQVLANLEKAVASANTIRSNPVS